MPLLPELAAFYVTIKIGLLTEPAMASQDSRMQGPTGFGHKCELQFVLIKRGHCCLLSLQKLLPGQAARLSITKNAL